MRAVCRTTAYVQTGYVRVGVYLTRYLNETLCIYNSERYGSNVATKMFTSVRGALSHGEPQGPLPGRGPIEHYTVESLF